jgi:3alpha(or 20beta)-hydroxysteroid dehydrogenase
MFRLNGKIALVNDAARGIGAAVAQAVAEEGAKVVIGDALNKEGAALATKIGPAARCIYLDVTKPAGWTSTSRAASDI